MVVLGSLLFYFFDPGDQHVAERRAELRQRPERHLRDDQISDGPAGWKEKFRFGVILIKGKVSCNIFRQPTVFFSFFVSNNTFNDFFG